MNRSQNGFTLVEVMVVVALAAILLALTATFYKQGFVKEYYYSAQQRKLQSAIQIARMRAIAGEKDTGNTTFAVIQTGNSTGAKSGEYYARVQFTTTGAHGLSVGDSVTFSGLDKHTGMNGGIFLVDQVASNTAFECPYFTKVNSSDSDSTGGVVRNVRSAAKLILKKQSAGPTDAELQSKEYFIYDDSKLTITDQAASSPIVIGFDSRGFASNPAGYTLYVAGNPAKAYQTKVLSITPFGKVKAGM